MTFRKELVGSLATFFSSNYIVLLIPGLLPIASNAQASIALTALMCAATTAVFGRVTGQPYMIGPGIVPASLCMAFLAAGIPWPTVLGICAVAGAAFTLLALAGVLTTVAQKMGEDLKLSLKYAIGYYLIAVALGSGGLSLKDGALHLSITGFAFLGGMAATYLLDNFSKMKDYAILCGMIVGTVIALATGTAHLPTATLAIPTLVAESSPDYTAVFQWMYVVPFLTMLYVLVADVVVTIDIISGSLAKKGGVIDQHTYNRTLVMSGLAATVGPLMGFCPFVVFFETLAGVESGSRTWRTSLMVAGGFLLIVLVSPLAAVVPVPVSAIALAVIGMSISKSSWKLFEQDSRHKGYSRVVRYLLYPALFATIKYGSISLALLSTTVAYPVALVRNQRTPRPYDWVVAAVCAALLAMTIKIG